MLPKKLQQKIALRESENALRLLSHPNNLVDFSSNDYLGFAKSKEIFDKAHQHLFDNGVNHNGATGSRLLSGNHKLYHDIETMLCQKHKCEASVVFNSGYDANIGFFSSVPQRGDVILYDEFCHASIRDGITMSNAKSYKFKHNDLKDLKEKIVRYTQNDELEIYVVTESVFSMDGDSPDLKKLSELCEAYQAHLIIDEAHALGVFGFGLVQKVGIEHTVFARLVTFGKALGCHGSAILGSKALKIYLINFCRSFIYTTALPPHTLATIKVAYDVFSTADISEKLQTNITFFKSELEKLQIKNHFIESKSAIQSCIIPENNKVKDIAKKLQQSGFDIKPILSPTVSRGHERLRFCLHSFNSKSQISEVLSLLATFVNQ